MKTAKTANKQGAWAQRLVGDDRHGARQQWNLALNLIHRAEWQLRYDTVVQLRKIQEPGESFTDLVLYSEEVLPDIKDKKTAGEVRLYLGRLHLNWAGKSDEKKNLSKILLLKNIVIYE